MVYMADLPKNRYAAFTIAKLTSTDTTASAGKPLRINLAKRFGIGKLTDAVPALHRHFQAVVPSPTAPLSEPIPCTKVIFDVEDVDRALRSIPEVNDIGLQSRPDGNVDAYVSLVSGSSLKQCDILQILSGLIPGFALPGRVEVFSGPLPRRLSGEIDFEQLVTIINKAHTSVMSKREEIVRDIFADLLQIDTGRIQSTSDFFLLGGNSLLLGKLSHQIRKKTSINIGIAELFSDSTVQAIASVIQEREVVKKPSMRSMDSYDDEKAVGKDSRSSSRTEFGIDYDYDMDMEQSEKKARRGQNHPISLIVQALPFIFFYPLKAAITCKCETHFRTGLLITLDVRVDATLHPILSLQSHKGKLLGSNGCPANCDHRSQRFYAHRVPSDVDCVQMGCHWALSSWNIPYVVQLSP